jgi:hypothetical protein
VGPCGVTVKTPEARRLRNLQWSVLGTWLAVGFAVLLLTSIWTLGDTGPRYRGQDTANRIVVSSFVGVAIAWFAALFPVVPIETRIRGLRWCRVVIYVTAVGWIVWLCVRPQL